MPIKPYRPFGKGETLIADPSIYLAELPGWSLGQCRGCPCLERSYKAPDFSAALALAVHIGALAERRNHHPLLSLTWGRLDCQWYTHNLGGIHENDVAMAADTEVLARRHGLA